MGTLISKESFKNMLNWSLESASIVNEKFENKIDEFHSQLSKDPNVSDEKIYIEKFNALVIDYVFLSYSNIEITDDEKVIGIRGTVRDILYDAKDCKPFLDLI